MHVRDRIVADGVLETCHGVGGEVNRMHLCLTATCVYAAFGEQACCTPPGGTVQGSLEDLAPAGCSKPGC